MKALVAIVEQEARKLRAASDAEEPLGVEDLERLEVLSKCAKLLAAAEREEPEEEPVDVEELRRRASG